MMPTSMLRRFSPFIAVLALCAVAAPMATSYATTTDLSPTPPDVTVGVAPNIAVTFDDSGSMGATHLPDGYDSLLITSQGRPVTYTVSTKYYFSANSNSQYYNPTVTYLPPLKADGVSRFPDSSYTAAPRDGICYEVNRQSIASCTSSATTFLVDLSKNFFSGFANQTSTGRGASEPGRFDIKVAIPNNSTYAGGFYFDCPTASSETGCVAVLMNSATADQKVNFANWYSYYRTRNLSTRSAIANVFAALKSNIRVVWQNLNSKVKLVEGTTRFLPFADTASVTPRSDFFNWLYAVPASGGTDSRAALETAGHLFTTGKGITDSTNPYWEVDSADPSKGKELTCRLNYSLLVTDGYWNQGNPTTPAVNVQKAMTLPDGVAYNGANGDAESKIFWNVPATTFATLGDIAFHYWAANLRPDFVGTDGKPKLDVPPSFTDYTDQNGNAVKWDGSGVVPRSLYFNPANDPATWPHVVQYMIALGINGQLSFPNDYAALRKGTKAWPLPSQVGNTNPANIDDTWHGAVNSRGQYFSARDPSALSSALSTLLTRILGRNSSGAAGSLSSSVLTGSGVAYQTGYNSANYSGKLTANSVDVDGNLSTVPLWDAAALLTARAKASDSRVILTSTGAAAGMGTAFTSTGAGAALKAVDATVSDDMIAYLRGNTSKEGTLFRTRASTLGAIINSQTVYVAFPASGYSDTFAATAPESARDSKGALLYSYEKFVSDHAKRAPTLYVGANDGMLHAFDATVSTTPADSVDVTPSPGRERWAYVPYSVYNKLSYLTAVTNFKFRPTVDGTPVTRDVFFSTGTSKGWHTILVGGLRLGGRGVYALDITDPSATEANAGSKVLWEFNNTTVDTSSKKVGANLGYTFGKPNIGRLANGKWVVLVPSGYFPSDTSLAPYASETTAAEAARTQSSLFVLDAQTGAVIREIVTPAGTTSYGLTSPVLGDYENDQIDDVAFAGDLVGNLWRFDLKDPDPAKWTVSLAYQPSAVGNATTPGPTDQPITVMPRLFPDPSSAYFMVVFGTGKYLGASDNVANDATKFQTVYGIRDRGPGSTATVTGRSTLVAQTLVESNNIRGLTKVAVPATTSTGANVDGWYIDLKIMSGSTQTNIGERVVVDATALFDSGRAIITSLIPGNDDPCNPVRRGAILVIDAATGGAADGVNIGTASFGAGYSQAGVRVDNVPISGSLAAAVGEGGGKIVVPGLTTDTDDGGGPFNIGDAVWRRRSWRELNSGQ